MGKAPSRFVAQAAAGRGWRIWDKKVRRWWGPVFESHPKRLVDELNAGKKPERLTELMRAEQIARATKEPSTWVE